VPCRAVPSAPVPPGAGSPWEILPTGPGGRGRARPPALAAVSTRGAAVQLDTQRPPQHPLQHQWYQTGSRPRYVPGSPFECGLLRVLVVWL
jgi:hypothetical protein